MLDRLSQLIKNKQLSSSQFADEIGVQRSSVSHVLSGRNKPSLDFITKVALRFPDINTEWLLTGRGRMLISDDEQKETGSVEVSQVDLTGDDEEDTQANILSVVDELDKVPVHKTKTGRDRSQAGSASIEKIVIFYNNGTFSEFLPNE